VPISVFEYTGEFERPVFEAIADRAPILQAVFDSLAEWKVSVEDVETITSGKLSERGMSLKLQGGHTVFQWTAASIKFTWSDSNWEAAEEAIRLLQTAHVAFVAATGAVISLQKTAVILHIQFKTKKFGDVLAPFIHPALQALDVEKVKTGAAIIKWDHRRVVLDGSGSIANGLFLRFERDFDGQQSFDDIAKQIHADETALFQMLDIVEDRS